MTLKNRLLKDPLFQYQNNIFYQKDFQRNNVFEEAYLKLREKENRLYSDDVVKELPEFYSDHPFKKEWEMRKSTLKKLVNHLQINNSSGSILELGCGNGWLSYNLAISLKAEICAVDINEIELLQGARVFGEQQNLCFVYSDIFSSVFKTQKFNNVILGGSVQYFNDLRNLIAKLLNLIDPPSKIYILDSPFYSSTAESAAAKKRSQDHFNSLGFPEMATQYFHHTFDELKNFNYKILYNPKSLGSLFRRKILNMPLSIFPIICITK